MWQCLKIEYFLKTNITGFSIYFFPKVNISKSNTVYFWPHLSKAKMCLIGVRWFWFSNFCLCLSAVCLQFGICHLSNAFWFNQPRVKNTRFQSFWKYIQLFVYLFTSTKMCQPAMVTYLQGSFLKFSLDSPWENNFEAYRTRASPQSCIQYFRQMVIIGRFPSLISDLRLISPCNEEKITWN